MCCIVTSLFLFPFMSLYLPTALPRFSPSSVPAAGYGDLSLLHPFLTSAGRARLFFAPSYSSFRPLTSCFVFLSFPPLDFFLSSSSFLLRCRRNFHFWLST